MGVVPMSAYYLIRSNETKEVFGILSKDNVLVKEDYDLIRQNEWAYFGAIVAKLEYITGLNVGAKNWYWIWEEITQAEYETYRDLHGFRVFVRNP